MQAVVVRHVRVKDDRVVFLGPGDGGRGAAVDHTREGRLVTLTGVQDGLPRSSVLLVGGRRLCEV